MKAANSTPTRTYHILCYYNKNLILLGGLDRDNKPVKDLTYIELWKSNAKSETRTMINDLCKCGHSYLNCCVLPKRPDYKFNIPGLHANQLISSATLTSGASVYKDELAAILKIVSLLGMVVSISYIGPSHIGALDLLRPNNEDQYEKFMSVISI